MSSIRVSTWLFWKQCYETALQSREGARTLEENNLVPRVLSYLSQQACEENPWNLGHKNPGNLRLGMCDGKAGTIFEHFWSHFWNRVRGEIAYL